MSTMMYYKEIKRFLKENIKFITIVAIVVSSLFFGFLRFFMDSPTANDIEVHSTNIDDLNVRNAQFRVYIENPHDTVFININLLEKVLFSEENIKAAETAIGIDIQTILDEQETAGFIGTQTDRGAIGIGRDPMTDTLVFTTKIGTEEDRLKTAEYFFDFLNDNELPVLNGKRVVVIETPHLHEYTELELKAGNAIEATKSFSFTVIIEAILSLFVGTILAIMMVFFYHMNTNKINYGFNYFVRPQDLLVIENNPEKILPLISEPISEDKIIVSQAELPRRVIDGLDNIDVVTANLLEIDSKKVTSEIIILVVEGLTSKGWYSEQLNFLKRLETKVRIIQTSKDSIE